MSDSNIIIYEKDSVDMTFTLDSNNSIITSFSATDKIIWALRQFNSGAAIILKEYTGVTGTTVTVSLTKEDTFKLRPQKYVYDLAVLRGSDRQTTVVKSASFLVADRSVQPKESATITLDTLTEYRTLIATLRGYSDSASQYASNAAASASSASSSLASINTLASSVSASKASVDASKASVDASISQFNTTVANAKSSIETQTSQSVNKVVAAELTARFDAEKCATNATSAAASALAAANSQTAAANSATNAATSAATASTAAQNTVSVYNEIQESTGALIEAASQAQPLMEQLAQKTAELLEAAEQTEQSVTAATNAATTAQGYADNASASASVASGYATTVNEKIEVVNNKINELSSNINQIATNKSDISSLQSGKQDVISDLATIRSNASTGAGLSSQVSTNTSSISSLNTTIAEIVTSDINALFTGTTADESNASQIGTRLDSLDDTVTSHTSSINSINSSISTLNTNVSTLSSGKINIASTSTQTIRCANYYYPIKILNEAVGNEVNIPTSNSYSGIQLANRVVVRENNQTNLLSAALICQNRANNKQASIEIGYDNNDNVFTYAPTPATTDSSTKIATTEFTNAFVSTFVNNKLTSPFKVFKTNISGNSTINVVTTGSFFLICKATVAVAGSVYFVGAYASVRQPIISTILSDNYSTCTAVGNDTSGWSLNIKNTSAAGAWFYMIILDGNITVS